MQPTMQQLLQTVSPWNQGTISLAPKVYCSQELTYDTSRALNPRQKGLILTFSPPHPPLLPMKALPAAFTTSFDLDVSSLTHGPA